MIYKDCHREGTRVLERAGVPEAELDARLLLEFVCGTDYNTLLAHGGREVSAQEYEHYAELLRKRAERIPLQHLTGVQDFMGLEFLVNPHVLVPRQDTETLAEEVLKHLHDGMRILDLCTGSGCILISLLHYSNDCFGIGADISGEALKVARENAERLLSAENLHGGRGADYEFIESDLFDKITGVFEIIVSNPPYIRSGEIDGLMPEVKDHEPTFALDGGEDGLVFYRRIAKQAKRHLCGGGMLFLEIGYDQGEEVGALLREEGYCGIQVVRDYAGLDRVVSGMIQ